MIIYKGKKLSLLSYMGRLVGKVFYMGRLVYESISSCFGSGVWLNQKPWSNEDIWRNQ